MWTAPGMGTGHLSALRTEFSVLRKKGSYYYSKPSLVDRNRVAKQILEQGDHILLIRMEKLLPGIRGGNCLKLGNGRER